MWKWIMGSINRAYENAYEEEGKMKDGCWFPGNSERVDLNEKPEEIEEGHRKLLLLAEAVMKMAPGQRPRSIEVRHEMVGSSNDFVIRPYVKMEFYDTGSLQNNLPQQEPSHLTDF